MAFDNVIDSEKLESEITATANAIRAKTGETSKIRWEENTGFATAVNAITTGGGSSEDVRYVTFMNEDGTVELGKKAVAVGDDCADPIARGIFDTPTKEPTAQYTYTFSGGWATTPGGGKDSNALKAVTEDRTVYANFISAVRYYTITYYDSDGTTVLKTESLAYGSVPSYKPTKDGYTFASWDRALSAVTGDTSYIAVWSEKITFTDGTWADIIRIAESGKAQEYFAVGDYKYITIDGVKYTLYIIGFNHDTLADGTGKAAMTLFSAKAMPDKFTLSNWQTLSNNMSTMLKPKLPSELQAAIKPVIKKCDVDSYNGVFVGTPIDVTFELFPLSFEECKIRQNLTYKYTDKNSDGTINTFYARYTQLGSPYAYFTNKYNSSYYGPYSMWDVWYYSTSNTCWMRQWDTASTNAGSTNGMRTFYSMSTSSKQYARATGLTEQYPVMWAFCI